MFAGGVLTIPEAPNASNRQNRHDILLEKIAQTKENRLKRVEENEATRQKLKDANIEWTNKIRFMLSELGNLKAKVCSIRYFLHLSSYSYAFLLALLLESESCREDGKKSL